MPGNSGFSILIEQDIGGIMRNDTSDIIQNLIQHLVEFQAAVQCQGNIAQGFRSDALLLFGSLMAQLLDSRGKLSGQRGQQAFIFLAEIIQLYALGIEHPDDMLPHYQGNAKPRANT